MGDDQKPGELDLSQVMGRVTSRWPMVLGLAFGGALVAFVITLALVPVYEAKATLVFPASNSNPVLPNIGLGSVLGSENMELVEGIVTSREVENDVVEQFKIERLVYRENLVVQQVPARRLLTLSYKSPSQDTGKAVIKNVLSHLSRLEESIGINSSERRLMGYREAFDEKTATVKAIEAKILEFQKRAKTVPDSDDQFTGMSYLKNRSDLTRDLAGINKEIETRRQSARKLGVASSQGLPSGLERETKWRDALFEASIAFDQVKQKYQPGTTQYKDAEEKLESTKKNLTAEIGKYVKSVEGGADLVISDLVAKQMVTRWQLDRAEDLARVAPIEAAEYRGLIEKLRVESRARDELQAQADAEVVRNKVEAKIWQVLDEPYVEEEPTNKKFGMNVGLGLVLGGLLGAMVSSRSGRR